MIEDGSHGDPLRGRSWAYLALLLALLGTASAYRLQAFVVPDMDEGVYVYAGKLIAEGSRPYRDFMLAHPPAVPYLAAAFWIAGGGSLAATRWFAIALTLLSCVPLFFLVRRIAASTAAGLIAVVLYHMGLVWLENLGRTVRLEVPLNAFLIGGLAAWMLGRRGGSAVLAGALLGGALATKLIAVVPIACLAAADLAWPRDGRADWRRRGWLVLGAALVLVPVFGWSLRQPGFTQWVLGAQLARAREPLSTRLATLGDCCLRFPFLVPGIAIAAWQLAQAEPRRRALGLAAVGSLAAAVLLFPRFFRHYLAFALPFVAALLAAALVERMGARTRGLAAAAALVVGVVSPVLFTELSLRRTPFHSSGAAGLAAHLRGRDGYLLTSAPDFALASGRTLVAWYYVVDNYLGRETGRLTDAEFAAAAGRASDVVLYDGELNGLPVTRGLLEARFRKLPVDPHWSAWTAASSDVGADRP